MKKKNHLREIEYSVLTGRNSVFSYDESFLIPSDRQLHKDAFQVRDGQVISKEDGEYVIEDARDDSSLGPGSSMKDHIERNVWHVKARKLADGKYISQGKLIEFDQNGPINILREKI